MVKKNVILVILLIGLVVFALVSNQGAEFGGADGAASDAIGEINPGYTAWFEPLWEPPSGEVESLLFALQAAVGTGFICFYLGYAMGKNKAGKARV